MTKSNIINISAVSSLISLATFLFVIENYGPIWYKLLIIPLLAIIITFVVLIIKWGDEK